MPSQIGDASHSNKVEHHGFIQTMIVLGLLTALETPPEIVSEIFVTNYVYLVLIVVVFEAKTKIYTSF